MRNSSLSPCPPFSLSAFWCPRKDSNLQPLVCPFVNKTALRQFVYSGRSWWSELESNQPFGLFRPALIHLSYPTEFGLWPLAFGLWTKLHLDELPITSRTAKT